MRNLVSSRLAIGLCVAIVASLIAENRACAQQGGYITQAAARLSKLVDKGNADGYSLQNNSFSIGGGWLKKGEEWVSIYTVQLTAGKQYRFLASGDNDAKDVDLRIMDVKGTNQFAADVDTAADLYAALLLGLGTHTDRLLCAVSAG